MKKLLLFLFCLVSFSLFATNKYWVNGTGNTNNTEHWSLTSGGASGAAVPGAEDDAIFNALSSALSYTVTVNADFICLNLTLGNPLVGVLTLAGSSPITVSGSISYANNMTNSYTGTFTFNATSSGKTITTNGVSIISPYIFNGAGGVWTLQDNFTSSDIFRIYNGTVNLNNKNVSCVSFHSDGSLTRALQLGSGTITLTGTGTIWDMTSDGMTLTSSTSTIKLTNATSTAKLFAGAGLTYNNVWITGTGTGVFQFSGSNVFADFKCDTPPHTILFTEGTTTTLTTFTVSGTVGNLVTIGSLTASYHTLIKAGGGTIGRNYLSTSYSTVRPFCAWFAGANSTNGGNNSGWTFTDPASCDIPQFQKSGFFLSGKK